MKKLLESWRGYTVLTEGKESSNTEKGYIIRQLARQELPNVTPEEKRYLENLIYYTKSTYWESDDINPTQENFNKFIKTGELPNIYHLDSLEKLRKLRVNK